MRRALYLMLVVSFSGTFALSSALSGCAKKKSASSASSGDASGSDASGNAKEMDVSSGSGRSDSGLPTVYFGFNEASVRSEDRDKLKTAADGIKASKSKVTIEGHCDERGSTEYNLALGERRAQAVKSYLTKLGVSAGSLSTISYGEERPASDGHGEDAWAKNRRGELVVNK